MRVLLTFTGFHDPYVPSGIKGEMKAGPILTVVAERSFDGVYLFSTPKTTANTSETADAIGKQFSSCAVTVIEVPLKDPTNYLGILRQLRTHFREINNRHPEAEYSVAVASGTPQMHACWLLLVASGEIPATVLQSTPSEFVPAGGRCVKEINVKAADFPHVVQPLRGRTQVESEDEAISTACRELGIVGDDEGFTKALREAYIYAQYDDVNLLLLGETGSGKEYFARFIAFQSHRAGPFIAVNCGGIPDELVESQLFGHKKGAFTGATVDSPGKFKTAEGGILFLDELGELPLPAQAKLLRVIEEGEIEPVGASQPIKVNVRVIAATNRNIRQMVAQGQFRDDLYQRFGAAVEIPPLRARKSDVPRLTVHILEAWNAKHKKQRRISADALTTLTRHSWPGNVRELRRVITQSAMLAPKSVIGRDELRFEEPFSVNSSDRIPEPDEGFQLNAYLDDLKWKVIQRAMEKTDGVQARAARLLGWTPQAMNQYLKARERK